MHSRADFGGREEFLGSGSKRFQRDVLHEERMLTAVVGGCRLHQSWYMRERKRGERREGRERERERERGGRTGKRRCKKERREERDGKMNGTFLQ